MRLISLLAVSLLSVVAADTLLQVQVLWRHGDRTPIYTYPTDPYVNYWGLPPGTLSKIGMQQHFAQGLKLRDRYVTKFGFINESYVPDEVYIRSADTPRCIQSAATNMAAFYSHSTFHPTEVDGWPDQWTPMAIHSVPSSEDNLLEEGSSSCARIDLLRKRRQELPAYSTYIHSIAPLLLDLTVGTGESISNAEMIQEIHDTLKVNMAYNLSLPSWCTQDMYNKLQAAFIQTDDFVNGLAGLGVAEDKELVMLRSGVLAKQIVDRFHEEINKKAHYKMYIYSAHDSTIAALFRLLHNKGTVLGSFAPHYAAMVSFELWKDGNGKPYVQVYYSDDAASPFRVITRTIAGCPNSDSCYLDTIDSVVKPYEPIDFWKQCANTN